MGLLKSSIYFTPLVTSSIPVSLFDLESRFFAPTYTRVEADAHRACASETSIARYGSSIPQFPREDLVHQHVRRFYTNTNNAGDQSDHRVWSITGRLLHTLQASLLDLADLVKIGRAHV